MRRAIVGFLAALVCLMAGNPLLAKEAVPLAQDEAAEKRLVVISSELRCLVCQNESLSGSNAELAHDLRREIRTQIAAGKSDGEIRDFMVSRYGDFVLYRPPLKGTTLLLWFGPGLLFVGGLVALIRYLRRRNSAIKDAPLSTREQEELDRLLTAKEPKK
jgi:cytochrome c-type biogenesis protein CcmH